MKKFEKQVEAARDEFIEYMPSAKRECSLVGFLWDDGLVVSNNTACHASMSHPPRKDDKWGILYPDDDIEYYEEDEDDEYYEEDEEEDA